MLIEITMSGSLTFYTFFGSFAAIFTFFGPVSDIFLFDQVIFWYFSLAKFSDIFTDHPGPKMTDN